MDWQVYNKAIASVVVGAIVALLKQFNLPVDQVFIDALGVIVLGIAVWFVPNKKARK